MDLKKIKVGKYINYTARTKSGRAKVVRIREAANGVWIDLLDKARDGYGLTSNVSVRASQITG